ncbi:MAG: carboxypeptidase regulatory-like domain-containing protein [Candidatus Eisenbacteria bacterium]
MRHLTVQQLSASLDGALVGVSLELVVRHLATCRDCRDRHARLSKQDDTLRHLLAWDPGAEFFEDASIRLEMILHAEAQGVAPARAADIESRLPRVTLDQVLLSANAQAQTPASAPAPAPREERPRPIPIEPLVLAQMRPPVVSPPPPPVAVPAQPAPEPTLAAPPVPTPLVNRAARAIPQSAPSPLRTLGHPSIRRAIPRWVAPVLGSIAAIALVWATLSALPPVIRIPAPELPRLPRLEWVRRARPEIIPERTELADITTSTVTSVRAQSPIAVPPELVVPTALPPALESPLAADSEKPRPLPPRPLASAAVEQKRHDLPAKSTPKSVPATTMLVTTTSTVAPGVMATPTSIAPSQANTHVDAVTDWPLLCGEVLDDTNTPVAGARVMLADLDLSARTDKRGRFCIAAPMGDRTLSVVALGFGTARQVVSLGAQTLEVHIALRPTP